LERTGDAPVRDFGPAARAREGVRVLSFTHPVAGPTVGRTLAEHGADVLGATRPNDYEHEFIYAEANVGSRSAYLDLDSPTGQRRAAALLARADVVVNNHRHGTLERRGLDRARPAKVHPGLVYVSVTGYGSVGPWANRGGFDMNASAASGLMTLEGTEAEPKLPVTGLINDYITGYMGAIGATAALVKQATEGGSWHVTVNLARTAMWCASLGLVDPALAGRNSEHSLRQPIPYDAPSPLGEVHMPPVDVRRLERSARPTIGPLPDSVLSLPVWSNYCDCWPPPLMTGPPSTARVWPLMYEAASLTKNRMALATSYGLPGRPIGTAAPIVAASMPPARQAASARGEAMPPTARQLTRIPCRPHSAAVTVVNICNAAFAAE
jgi:CoA-transferase family III